DSLAACELRKLVLGKIDLAADHLGVEWRDGFRCRQTCVELGEPGLLIAAAARYIGILEHHQSVSNIDARSRLDGEIYTAAGDLGRDSDFFRHPHDAAS